MLPIAKLRTLKNGARIVTAATPSELTTIVFAVRAGARCETPGTRGLAHLVEHQVFKGGSLYPTAEEVNAAVASIGATYNASTNMEFTYYVIECAKARAAEAYRILSDVFLRPRFDPKEFTREKMVVLEEILRSRVDQTYYLSIIFEDLLYGHQPLGRDINGTLRSVRALTRTDVVRFVRRRYVGRNVCALFIGGGDLGALASAAARDLALLPRGAATRWKPYRPAAAKRSVRHLRRDDEMTAIMAGVPGVAAGSRLRRVQDALGEALAGPTSSRLYNRLREREGLVYEIFGGSEHYSDASHVFALTETDPKHAERVVGIVLEEFRRAAEVPFGKDEIASAKAQLLAAVARAPEDRERLAREYFCSIFFEGGLRQLSRTKADIEAVTAEEVNRLARRVFAGRRYVASVGKKPLRIPARP